VLAAFFGLIFLPYVALGVTNYIEGYNLHTQSALSRRQSLAQLSALALQERFDHVVDVGRSLASRVQFRQQVSQAKWDEAIKILATVPRDFTYIDQVALFDPSGNLKALNPYAEGVIGKNFAYRDYYKGVSKHWQPYVSDVFSRAAEPHYNVVVAAVPIKTDNQQVLGILVLTIKVDTFAKWAKEATVGPGGFVYYVDKSGNVVGHPEYGDQDAVKSFANETPVQRVLRGQQGITEVYNKTDNEQQVVAYEPVKAYGWGAIVQQSSAATFGIRDQRLHQLIIFYTVSTLFLIILAYAAYRFMKLLYLYREREKVFLESVGDGLIAIDRAWNITLWNKAATSLSGFSAAETIGRPLREVVKFVRQSDGSENIAFIEETMLYGTAHSMTAQTLLVRKDGSRINIGDSAAPVFNDKGEVTGAIIVFRDVSEQYRVQQLKDEFFSIASHELRTPLTAIRGDASMILQYYGDKLNDDPDFKEMVADIHSGSVRLIELVNDFLDSSRLEQGRIKFKLNQFDLVPVIQDVLGDMESVAKEKGLELKLQPPPENLLQVRADVDRLKQILFNLIGNALKFTERGGVNLELKAENNLVKIRVIDTGSGISAAQQKQLFQKFQQAGRTTMTGDVTQGSGLGLYISRMLAEGMGGKLELEHSVEGQGSTFVLSLPAAPMMAPGLPHNPSHML
jgi:PAS domain S-box-containing protein